MRRPMAIMAGLQPAIDGPDQTERPLPQINSRKRMESKRLEILSLQRDRRPP